MITPPRRGPSKISGLIYILLGMFALFISGFGIIAPTSFFGMQKEFRIGFSIIVGIYGAWRVMAGLSILRQHAAGLTTNERPKL